MLIEMPVAGLDDVMSVKKPGTMLVPVEEDTAEPAAETGWRRYKVPGLIAAGVLVGLIAGGLLFSGGADNPAPETASNDSAPREQEPVSPPAQNTTTAPATTTTQEAAPAQNAPVRARWWRRSTCA